MKTLANLFNAPLKYLLLFIITWVIVANFLCGVYLSVIIALLATIAIFFIVKHLAPHWHWLPKIRKITTKKWLYPTVIIFIFLLGTIARLSFLHFDYHPTYDPATFFYNAKSLAETNTLDPNLDHEGGIDVNGNTYFATYPYEMGYTATLAISNILFGGGLFSVIILNLLFDILGAFLAFQIAKKLLPDRKWLWLLSAALYFLNPFNITFSVIALPIVAVNAIIMLVILLTLKLTHRLSQPKRIPQTILLAAILGIILGIGNSFRPLFTVLLIAIMLTIAYLLISKIIKHQKTILAALASAALVILCFFATTQINFLIVDNYAGISAARNASGWALYVGSNPETYGKWGSKSDIAVRNELWNTHPNNIQAVHNELSHLALKRYEANGIANNLDLFVNKALIANGDQSSSMYNTSGLKGYRNSTLENITKRIADFFIITISAIIVIYTWRSWGKGSKSDWVFLSLAIIGLSTSSLLVEVKNRYFVVLLPFMIVLMIYAIDTYKPRKT
jgi:hypothetical protein